MAQGLDRRNFLKGAGTGGAVAVVPGTLAAPALARTAPVLNWQLTSSFPQSLATLFGAAEVFATFVAEASDKKFSIKVLPPGKAIPALKAADAVTKGKVEMAHTASHFYWRTDPTFALGTGVPFGLNARQMSAWMYEGGGAELMNEFYARHNIYAIPAGNTGCQMGGWWRKPVRSLADLKGRKVGIGGYAGSIMAKIGAVPREISGERIYDALKSGALDAAEWVGPHDDEKLGLYKAAKNYYYPGWWESGPMIHVFVNRAKWETLPKNYRTILKGAGHAANALMLARYDARNPAALRRLLRRGVQLKAFSNEIMTAAFDAAEETYAETASANDRFKKVYESWKKFRADQYLWMQVAELGMDAFQSRAVNRR